LRLFLEPEILTPLGRSLLSSVNQVLTFCTQILIIQKFTTLYCVAVVIRFYRRNKGDMAVHKPLFKLVSFKLVAGVNFIQSVCTRGVNLTYAS
jgi:hypothetical protein